MLNSEINKIKSNLQLLNDEYEKVMNSMQILETEAHVMAKRFVAAEKLMSGLTSEQQRQDFVFSLNVCRIFKILRFEIILDGKKN